MRYVIATAMVVTLMGTACAHFVFVYVDGDEARVVFGHKAEPDPTSFPSRAEKTSLTARDATGKETKLTTEKGAGNFYRAKFPAEKPVVVYGTTDAGVTQRGDNPPMLTWYYPKVVVGDAFAKQAEVGAAVPLEVVPVRDGVKVRFKVLAAGKPLPDIDVVVGQPGKAEEQTVKTDKDGLTVGFGERGRYCIGARRVEDKSGEYGGKQYSSVRHVATLVFDFPAPNR